MLHTLALLGGLEALLRASGHAGLFGWFARTPWGNPGIAGLLLSMLLFGLRGMVAQPQATLQPNLNHHNTMWAPGHFHFAVVGGTTLAFTTLSHHVVLLLTLRKPYSVSLARLQTYVSFMGIPVMALAMAWLDGLELLGEPLYQRVS
jgi:cytochrome c oxidase subunit 1